LNTLVTYCDRVIQWLPRQDDAGALLTAINNPCKEVIEDAEAFPDLTREEALRTAVLINGTFNHHHDIQGLLLLLKARLSRTSRVLVVLYNPYLRWLYTLANMLGVRRGELPSTFVTRVDIENIAEISGFQIVRQRHVAYAPWRLFGIGDFVNRLMPPRGSPQNRPVGVTSKAASETHPGQPFFYLTCGGYGKVFLIKI